AEVIARVTGPSGTTSEVPLSWTIDRDGAYAASFSAGEEGLHRVDVVATVDGRTITGEPAWFRVAPGTSEYYDAGLHADLLRRIAEETGGRYYTLDQIERQIGRASCRERGYSVADERHI